MPLIISNQESTKLSLLLANFNSFVLDYITRQMAGGGNLNFFIVEQFPIIPPIQYHKGTEDFIVPKVFELTYTAWDLEQYSRDIWMEATKDLRELLRICWQENATATGGGNQGAPRPAWLGPADPEGFPYPPFKWDEKRRDYLRAELDGLYAHLYGLARDEFEYVLETFPIVRRKDEQKFGEYRTKRLCLEAYDRLMGSELIPPEAQERSRHSVLKGEYTAPAPKPAAPQVREAGAGYEAKSSAPLWPAAREASAPRSAPKEEPKPKPAPDGQMALSDFGLYKCQACGARVLGYDKGNHTREVHGGKDPGYKKLGS